jgi:hypothetical protein
MCWGRVTVIVTLDVFLTLLALMAWPGGDINNVRQQHGATLVSRKVNSLFANYLHFLLTSSRVYATSVLLVHFFA